MTGRSRSAVAQCERVGQLSNALLTLMVALAAGLDVGLMALTRRTPTGGRRLLTLQNDLWPSRGNVCRGLRPVGRVSNPITRAGHAD